MKIKCEKYLSLTIKTKEVLLIQMLRTLGNIQWDKTNGVIGINLTFIPGGRKPAKRILNGLRTKGFALINGILCFIVRSLYSWIPALYRC